MVAGKSPEKLPQGWKEHIKVTDGKKYKYFTDPETGKKFYSKTSVMKYVNAKSNDNNTPVKKDDNNTPQTQIESSESKSNPDINSTPQPQDPLVKDIVEIKDDSVNLQSSPQPSRTRGKTRSTRSTEGSEIKADTDNVTPQSRSTPKKEGSKSKVDKKEGSESKVDEKEGSESKAETDIIVTPLTRSTRKKGGSESKEETDGIGNITPPPESAHEKEGSETKADTEIIVTPVRSTRKKEGSEIKSSTGGVELNENPSWLPQGWTTEVRKKGSGATYKVYTDPSSKTKFYSKPEVTRYLNKLDQTKDQTLEITPVAKSSSKTRGKNTSTEIICTDTTMVEASDNKDEGKNVISENKNKPSTQIVCFGTSPNNTGLPAGWVTEYKPRNSASGNKRDPYYTDPESGYSFRSKKDCFRYLETGDIKSCNIKPRKRSEYDDSIFIKDVKKPDIPIESSVLKEGEGTSQVLPKGRNSNSRRKKKKGANKSSMEIVPYDGLSGTNNYVLEELPPGWFKEIKITQRAVGSRKDTFYVDPVAKYMFRSKKDVARYLETKDINSCVSKPMKWDPNDSELINKDAVYDFPVETSIPKEDVEKPVAEEKPVNENQGGPISEEKPLNENQEGPISSPFSGPSSSKRKRKSISKPVIDIDESMETDQFSTNVQMDVIEVTPAEGLPIGWVKETKTTRNMNGGIRRDSSFTDPESGYNFRSKKDALRFIETGDITKCLMKPRKSIANSPSIPVTGVQLISPEKPIEGGLTSQTPPHQPEPSKSVETVLPESLTNSIPELPELPEKKKPNRRKSRKNVQSSVPESISNTLMNNELPVLPVTNTELPETKSGSKKSKKPVDSVNSVSSSGRVSKRLAGSQPEMPNLQISEREIRAAMKECEEVDIMSIINVNSVPPNSGGLSGGVSGGFVGTPPRVVGIPVTTPVTPVLRFDSTEKAMEIDRNVENSEPLDYEDDDNEEVKDVEDIVSMVVDSVSKFEVSDMNEEPPIEEETVNIPVSEVNLSREIDKKNENSKGKGVGREINEKNENLKGKEVGREIDEKNENLKGKGQKAFQFLDSWSDPCLDFAFKTLTGTFPDNNSPSGSVSQPKPVVSQPIVSQPIVSQPKPIVSQPKPITPQPQIVVSQPQIVASHHQTESTGSFFHQTGSAHHQTESTGSFYHHSESTQHQTGSTFQQQTQATFQHQSPTYIQRNEYFTQQTEPRSTNYQNTLPTQQVQMEQSPRTSTFFPTNFSQPLFGSSQVEQWPRNLNSLPSENFTSPTTFTDEVPPGFTQSSNIPPGFTLPFGTGKPSTNNNNNNNQGGNIPPGFNAPNDQTNIPPGFGFFGGYGSNNYQRNDNYK